METQHFNTINIYLTPTHNAIICVHLFAKFKLTNKTDLNLNRQIKSNFATNPKQGWLEHPQGKLKQSLKCNNKKLYSIRLDFIYLSYQHTKFCVNINEDY